MAAKKKTAKRMTAKKSFEMSSKTTRITTRHPLPDMTTFVRMSPQLVTEFIGIAFHHLAHATMTMSLLGHRLAEIELGPDATAEEVGELSQRIQTKLLRESYDYDCREALTNAIDMVCNSVVHRP